MTDAFIYDAIRTPRGRKGGGLQEVGASRLSAFLVDSLLERTLERSGAEAVQVDDLVWGNVTQIGEQGGCLARNVVLRSGLDNAVPGVSVNRFCASGLEAVNLAAMKVKAGEGQSCIAGGVEMMSRIPMGSDGAPYAVDPQLAIHSRFVPQGISADLIATEFGFSREECDRFAVDSQERAATAWQEGRFAGSIVPVEDVNGVTILDRDEHVRPDTSVEILAGLEPSFRKIGEAMPGFDRIAIIRFPHLEAIDHVHHPGNSSGIVDGAALALVGSREFGTAHGLRPRARFVASGSVGSDPTMMLTGPVPAAESALRRAGMTVGDVDLFEINEAFAVVPLHFMRQMGLGPDKVNVNGGAIAMGHPLGATGAMILGTALDELERRDGETALVTLCVGGGMGVATIIERAGD